MNIALKTAYFGWLLQTAEWQSANASVERLASQSGRSALRLWCDLLWCAFWYGATFDDYFLLRFHEKTETERSTYITMREWRHHRKRVNRESHVNLFRDKGLFAERFREFFRRESCDLRKVSKEEAVAWIAKRDQVVGKLPLGLQGIGILKIAPQEVGGAEAAWQRFVESGATFLEELIVQHPAVARFNPESVNTVRVITLRHRDRVEIMCARFGIGNGALADNIPAGGVAASVELDSGVLGGLHHKKDTTLLDCHPRTGVFVRGEVLPHWQAVLQLAVEAAKVVPEIRSVGWDIAILPDGVCLVEGNDNWGHVFPQVMAGRGLKFFFGSDGARGLAGCAGKGAIVYAAESISTAGYSVFVVRNTLTKACLATPAWPASRAGDRRQVPATPEIAGRCSRDV